MTVELIQSMGNDLTIVNNARVSFHKRSEELTEADKGLINYLAKNKHGTPFEAVVFQFRLRVPIGVAREVMRHRVACLPGDTSIICVQPNGTVYNRTIEHLYRVMWGAKAPERWEPQGGKHRNGEPRLRLKADTPRYRSLGDGHRRMLRVFDETTGRLTTNAVKDIWQTGDKPVFRIETEDHRIIRASADHRFLTPDGWTTVRELSAKDAVLRQGWVAAARPGSAVPPSLRAGIGVWTTMQRKHLIDDGAQCYLCHDFFPAAELDLDHVVPVVEDLLKSLDPRNLAPCCKVCHREKTNHEQILAHRGTTVGVRRGRLLTAPRPDTVEATYDIEMEFPHHNYFANKFLVHNSFNEESSRYVKLQPDFYLPEISDVRTQVGKPGHYMFEPVEPGIAADFIADLDEQYKMAYAFYEQWLERGVARELVRNVLPLGILTEFVMTINFRSLTNFLSLRTAPDALLETRKEADAIELIVSEIVPIAYQAWVDGGRKSL